ncbi:MAG: cobyrinate a,c-diamide synthase [Clostridiales bacterium]|nr:cobyrinate a,c-diamide synthase [Clostridiales bacterium]
MKAPRVMIAAASSGSGKTLITCGILQALCQRGMVADAFKCGPDYIDPMFHTRVIGTPCRNLDPFFCDEEMLRYLFLRSASRFTVSILEGVMGYYDGVAGTSLHGSSYDLARITKTPVVLVVNTRGMSRSIVPLIQGMVRYREDSHICGVILNRMSPSLYPEIRDIVEEECGIKVLGYVPPVPEAVIESRHLGLVTPEGVADLKEKLDKMAEVLKNSVDLDALLALADAAEDLEYRTPAIPDPLGDKKGQVRIAAARDEAFCFYYEDNLDLLRQMGAEIVEFSPLRDSCLPDGIHGLILPGGYPELFADVLEKNESMRRSIYEAVRNGLPSLAECGGFMYLHREMEDMKGNVFQGVGLVDGKAYRTEKLGRFGYITLTANRDQILGKTGTKLRAHEFHYFDSTSCGDSFHAQKPSRKRNWDCIHGEERCAWGFPHLYFYSNPEAASHFVEACADYKKEQADKET